MNKIPLPNHQSGEIDKVDSQVTYHKVFFENPRAAEVLNMYHVSILKLASVLWHSTDVNFGIFIIFCLTSIRVNGIIFQEKNACSPWKKDRRGFQKNWSREIQGISIGPHPRVFGWENIHLIHATKMVPPGGFPQRRPALCVFVAGSVVRQPRPATGPEFSRRKKTPVGFPERHP